MLNDDEGTSNTTTPALTDEAAVDSVFDRVFGDNEAAVAKELGDEYTPLPDNEKIPAVERELRTQKEELVEEGLESEDGSEVPADTKTKIKADADTETVTPAAQGDKATTTDAGDTAGKPALDDTLRFVANEFGWTDEKIDRLLKADPELALETFNQFADTYANLSRQFSTAPASPVAPGTQGAVETPAQPSVPTPKLDAFYAKIEEFAEANGEQLGDFAKHLKAELIEPVKVLMAEARAAKEAAENEATRSIFSGLTTKFAKVYGEEGKRTPEQTQSVAKLAQTADQLIAGAKVQGRTLSVKDALNQAHVQVSEPIRTASVRSEIQAQVQRRTKQITAKPTQRVAPGAAATRSRQAAGDAIDRFYAERGISPGDDFAS